MNTLMKFIALFIALSCISTAQAQIVNCLFGFAQFSDSVTLSPLFANIQGEQFISTYHIPTTHTFNSGVAYFNVTLNYSPYFNSTIFYKVNNGPVLSTVLSSINPGPFQLNGLNPLGSRCSVENYIGITVDQRVYSPERNDTCTYDFHYYFTTTATSVCGDPQFVGLLGQSYQIHGIDGAVYNLISSKNYAVNAQFTFLSGPRPCPIMPTTGKRSAACWSHDGSYLSNFAVVTKDGDKFLAVSGEAATGFSSVKLNDRALTVGDSVTFSEGSIFFNSTHEVTVQVGAFYIEVESIDGFVNLRRARVSRSDWALLAAEDGTHGLLGQTWQNKRYSGKVPEIEGSPDDYVIVNDDIFGTEFPYSRMA